MTDKLDFKGVLEAIEDDKIVDRTLDQVTGGSLETIQIALRLADRLQSGEVSDAALIAVGTMDNYDFDTGRDNACADQDHIKWFKAMSAQMMKEVCDE